MKAYIGNRAIPRKVSHCYEFFCTPRLSAIRFNPTGIFSADYPDGLNLNPSVTSIEQGTIDSSD
jgi:hypothetical protein